MLRQEFQLIPSLKRRNHEKETVFSDSVGIYTADAADAVCSGTVSSFSPLMESLRDYDMALNVVRIWLQSGEFALCHTEQLIKTYELDESFFSALIGLSAIESHYSQAGVFKVGATLERLSAASVINAIQGKFLKTDSKMEEMLKQWITEIIRPIVMEAVRDVLQEKNRALVKQTMDLPENPLFDKPQPEDPPVEAGYLNRKQAAEFLGVSETTLNTYIYTGKISGEKKGNKTFFLESDLVSYKNSLQRKRYNES